MISEFLPIRDVRQGAALPDPNPPRARGLLLSLNTSTNSLSSLSRTERRPLGDRDEVTSPASLHPLRRQAFTWPRSGDGREALERGHSPPLLEPLG